MGGNGNQSVGVFDRDARANRGYLYTASGRLSSRLATTRSTEVLLGTGCFEGKSVLDVGCGDGFYTRHYWDRGGPRALTGIDAATGAIEVANLRKGDRPIEFVVGDSRAVPFGDNSFDVVLLQSILHHDDRPFDTIREAFRLAPEVLIHEPNGNNFGLKAVEKLSTYHREHHERSYSPRQLQRWVERAGGRVVREQFAGFVPMFCPNWLALSMKKAEPVLEALPGARNLGCAVYVLLAAREA